MLEKYFVKIWKYDDFKRNYLYIDGIQIVEYSSFRQLEYIFPIEKNKIIVASDDKIVCFQIDDKGYYIVLKVNISENHYFLSHIYKKKYIFSRKGFSEIFEVFHLEKQMFIFNFFFPFDIIIKDIFPLNNGNLLIVYWEESSDSIENFKLLEATIFER